MTRAFDLYYEYSDPAEHLKMADFDLDYLSVGDQSVDDQSVDDASVDDQSVHDNCPTCGNTDLLCRKNQADSLPGIPFRT